MLLHGKKLIFCMVLIFSAALVGCSKPGNGSSQTPSSQTVSSVPSSAVSSEVSASVPRDFSASQEDAYKDLLISIQKEARQGRVINCEFSVDTQCMENVQAKWGKEDKTEYVVAAKGTYSTYTKKGMVFGYNKGDQLFEIRTFDNQLKEITFSEVKDVLGKPAHDVISGKERIIGYVVSEKYKLLFVFANAKADGESAKLDHYSVFYPQGTVNSMADDPGREW